MMHGRILFTVALLLPAIVSAQGYISIIIDDLGNSMARGRAVIETPADVTLAILPKTHFSSELAELAALHDKEVMLHLPMEPIEHHDHTPGTLRLDMSEDEFLSELESNIASVPHIRGINNHMGSRVMSDDSKMNLLMDRIAKVGGLYFIDSRTSTDTIAEPAARKVSLPALPRDIFIDPDFRPETIKRQFDKLVSIARTRGYAIGIAHPHPRTIAYINDQLAELEQSGIEIVKVSELLEHVGERNVVCLGTDCTGI